MESELIVPAVELVDVDLLQVEGQNRSLLESLGLKDSMKIEVKIHGE